MLNSNIKLNTNFWFFKKKARAGQAKIQTLKTKTLISQTLKQLCNIAHINRLTMHLSHHVLGNRLGSGAKVCICCHQNIPKHCTIHIQYSTCISAQENPTHLFIFENTFLKHFQLQSHQSIPSKSLRSCQRECFDSHITARCIYAHKKKIHFSAVANV